MTVAGTATLGEGRVLKSVAESAALGEGLLVIPLLIVLLGQLPSPVLLTSQISVSDLLPHITLLLTLLSRFPHCYMVILKTFYKHQLWPNPT